ncbi:MAG: hypothetical protein DI570_03725 [Phenylobacterium zucineum]|nr:MAG: hypothetical protein DI570_03725 [Phenylobacterium zucineum]
MRGGRVVAVGRAILALFLVAAFFLGPHNAPAVDRVVTLLLAANLAWSLALLAASRSRILAHRLIRVAPPVTAIDFAVFTLLLYLTSGADSPFFTPFIILILGATIQWGSRGALVTGAVTLAIFTPAGWEVLFGNDRGIAAAQAFVVRLGYTMVASAMLAAFGRHMEGIVDELSRLSDPISDSEADAGPPIQECLRHALWVFGARRGVFLWEEDDEPYANLAGLDDGHFETRRMTPTEEPWVAEEVSDSAFIFDADSGASLLRRARSSVVGPARPLAAALLAATRFERALVIPAAARELRGWLMVFDHEDPANEDLAIGVMVGAQVSVALERWESQRARREAVAVEDRIRLSRDLHDGVLQFLAGAGLQLDGLAGTGMLPEAETRIASLREAIREEQRELRGFISTLRPDRSGKPAPHASLAPDLERIARQLSRYWSIEVTAEIAPRELTVPDSVAYDMGRILREAVANAVRHGGARHVRAHIATQDDGLAVLIEDDGTGFAFEGEPGEMGAGDAPAPWSLQERIRAMGGTLRLGSRPRGAALHIRIPLGAA